jgi:hypothetical protein
MATHEPLWNLENYSVPEWDWEGGDFEACVQLFGISRPTMSPTELIKAFRGMAGLAEASELNAILDAWQQAIELCRGLVAEIAVTPEPE